MKKELKRDLDNLVKDIETYIVEKEQTQFLNPLRYRLGLIEEKYEQSCEGFGMAFGRDCEQNLQFAKAILY